MKFKEYKGLDLAATAADVLKEWDENDIRRSSSTKGLPRPTDCRASIM